MYVQFCSENTVPTRMCSSSVFDEGHVHQCVNPIDAVLLLAQLDFPYCLFVVMCCFCCCSFLFLCLVFFVLGVAV